MCNLYSMIRNQAAIRDLFKIGRDTSGNLPPLTGIFPDQMAPVVRVNDGERELTIMRWGMPNPPQFPGFRRPSSRQPAGRGPARSRFDALDTFQPCS
jgi:putative SOS response-associated peptidase YedK